MKTFSKFLCLLFILVIFGSGCKQEKGEIQTTLKSFKVDFKVIECKSNLNNNVLEIKGDKGNVAYYNKDGELLFNKKIHKQNVIFDTQENLVVAWDNNDHHIYVYDNKGTLENVLTFSAKINLVNYVEYENKSYYLIFLNNYNFYIYNILPNGHYKFKMRNSKESVRCLNSSQLPDILYLTETGSVYKFNLNKKLQPKVLVENNSPVKKNKAMAIGKNSFLVLGVKKYYCLNSDGEVYFYVNFNENEDWDKTKIYCSNKGRYIIFNRETIYQNSEREREENIITMYETKYNTEMWTTGSLFKNQECLCVDNYGDTCIVEDNKIVKYSREFIPIKTWEISGRIISSCHLNDFSAVVTDKNDIYII